MLVFRRRHRRRSLSFSLCLIGLIRLRTAAPAAKSPAKRSAPSNKDAADLWAALKHATGFSDSELSAASKEILQLPAPSQRAVWSERVHCGDGACAGEAAARLLSTLGESDRMPLRGFEPFPGDPLYKHWKAEDTTEFHSWVDGNADDKGGLKPLIPEGQPLVIPRWQSAEFFRQAKERILNITGATIPGSLGRCLEWDTPHYIVKGFGRLCYKYDVLTYANEAAGVKEMLVDYPMGSRWIATDITSPPDWMPGDYGVVVCLFVLEHVTDPAAAVRGVARALAPGGFALLGAPFADGIHACPDDYFRYTPHGLRHLTEDAGLEVLFSFSPGSPVVAAGEFLGMKSSYWTQEDLFAESDSHPLNVFLLARKPTTARWWRPPRQNATTPKPGGRGSGGRGSARGRGAGRRG